MTSRFDAALQKYPDHEDGIRLLAERDPSNGKLKYLEWGAKVLGSGQALAPEIADVLDLFHRFAGQRLEWLGGRAGRHVRLRRRGGSDQWINPDIYSYQTADLAKLRDLLLKFKRAADRKQRKREKLYRIEGAIEAEVVYDSADLIVRHVKNKQASVHYGHNTKWCTSMQHEGYFEDYESHNATFFFFERKATNGDEYDKVALMLPRSGDYGGRRDEIPMAFTALDNPVDMMALAKVYGIRVFDIFRQIYECSERYPGSTMFQVYAGIATEEQLRAVIAMAAQGTIDFYEVNKLIEAICCNDAATWPLLMEIEHQAYSLSIRASKSKKTRSRRRLRVGVERHAMDLVRLVKAALLIHPQTPVDERARLTKELRKRHVPIDAIHRVRDGDRIGVSYEQPTTIERGRTGLRRHRRRLISVKWLRERSAVLGRAAKRYHKRAGMLERKLAEEKRRRKAKAKVAKKRS